jgi:hypothetical protein
MEELFLEGREEGDTECEDCMGEEGLRKERRE